jgi:hypothetical protein
VLPVRIELTTSPYHTDAFASAECSVCALDHPFAVGSREPVGAARLASTPSRRTELGSGLPSAEPDGFPEFRRCAPDCFQSGGQIYQGGALPLSYGSEVPKLSCLSSIESTVLTKGVLPSSKLKIKYLSGYPSGANSF